MLGEVRDGSHHIDNEVIISEDVDVIARNTVIF